MILASAQIAAVQDDGARKERNSAARLLYQEHRDQVFHLCLRLSGGNRCWAEDATHDVFVALLEQLDQLADRQQLGGWVYRVTMNTCMTRLKREGSIWGKVRLRLMGEVSEGNHDTPERRVRVRQDLEAALAAIAALPAQQRVAFCMCTIDDLSQREIAGALSLSEGYVSKLLHKARKRLQREGWEGFDA
ncbi:MAG: sigma-70 family RNA polymerase sigma factor [Deltaproteobacteria bacterium]|nr:sigma-70 family RNA polymerase sigma factor [Deltaproteobacteria bacterium]